MVAAGRSLVGRGSLLHQFKGNHLAELGEIKVKHMTHKAAHVSANGGDQFTGFRSLNRYGIDRITGHVHILVDAVHDDIVIVNFLVAVFRGEATSLTLYANNLTFHFLYSLSAGLTFFVFFTASTLFFVLFGQVQGLSAFVRIIKLQGAVFFSKNTCVGETTMLYLNSHEISKEC